MRRRPFAGELRKRCACTACCTPAHLYWFPLLPTYPDIAQLRCRILSTVSEHLKALRRPLTQDAAAGISSAAVLNYIAAAYFVTGCTALVAAGQLSASAVLPVCSAALARECWVFPPPA